MITKETKREKDILTILNNNDIRERMVDDHTKNRKSEVSFDLKKYIGCYVDDKIIGLAIYRKFKRGSVAHFYVLPEYRQRYARKCAKEALKFKPEGDVFTITPLLYKEVINFALKVGFECIGIHKEVFTKNGINYKQAITRLKK